MFQHLIFWLIVYFVCGILSYYLDLRYGIRFYRTWYNWTHSDKLPETEIRGIIFGQRVARRFALFTFVSFIHIVYVIIAGRINPLGGLVMLVLQIPAGFIGFYAAPKINPYWKKREEKFFAIIEDIESGKLDMKDAIKKAGKRAGMVIGEVRDEISSRVSDSAILKDESDEVPPSTPEKKVEDPRKSIENFARGGRKKKG